MNNHFARWAHFEDLSVMMVRYSINAAMDRYLIVECCEPPEESLLKGKSFQEIESYYEAEGDVILTGSIKWGGYSNWNTDCIHCCNRGQLFSVGAAMLYCYDWCKEVHPDWDL